MMGFILFDELKYVKSEERCGIFFVVFIFDIMFMRLYNCLLFLILSFGKVESLFFKVVLIIFGLLYLFFRCFYSWVKVIFGFILVVFMFCVYFVDFGFNYLFNSFIFFKDVKFSLFIMFLKFVFYFVKYFGWLLNFVSWYYNKFFFVRNLDILLICLLFEFCFGMNVGVIGDSVMLFGMILCFFFFDLVFNFDCCCINFLIFFWVICWRFWYFLFVKFLLGILFKFFRLFILICVFFIFFLYWSILRFWLSMVFCFFILYFCCRYFFCIFVVFSLVWCLVSFEVMEEDFFFEDMVEGGFIWLMFVVEFFI